MKKKLRRTLATVLSVLMVAGVVSPVEAGAQESPYDPITHLDDAYAYAYGGLLDLRLLYPWLTKGKDGPSLDTAELQGVDQLWEIIQDNGQLAEGSTLDLQLLHSVYLNLGQLSIPLLGEGGLLEFVLKDASVGVLREHAHAPYSTTAQGGVGVVGDSGSLEVTQPGEGANATVDLLSLLNLRTSDFATQTLLNEVTLSLGAVSAIARNAEFDTAGLATCEESNLFDYHALHTTDLSGNHDVLVKADETLCSGYQVADAMVTIDAPVVKNVVTELNELLKNTQTALNGSIGENGVLGSLVSTLLGIKAEITLPVDTIIFDLVNTPLTSSDELVTIDLSSGEISIDLKKLHVGNPDGLNGLAPNTSLITSEELEQITEAITNLLTAGANEEPNGLNARIDKLIRGEKDTLGNYTYRSGVYASEVSIEICQRLLPNGSCLPLTKVIFTTTLGGLLTGAEKGSQAQYDEQPYNYYIAEGDLGIITGLILSALLEDVGQTITGLLFADGTGLLGGLQATVLSPLLSGLSPLLELVLDPLAKVIINRQTLQEVNHGSVLTVSAVEMNVLELGIENGKLINLPLATASVMVQIPVTLDFDVAKVGNGRELHADGYSYNIVCRADREYIPDEGGDPEKQTIDVLAPEGPLTYPEERVGSGLFFDYLVPDDTSKHLYLTGSEAGGLNLTTPLRIMPGAECTVTLHEALSAHRALRPTGMETETRTPYTYFLDTDGTHVLRSGSSGEDGITTMSPIADFEIGQVPTDIESVDEAWKDDSFTFIVPTGKDTHRISIVHAYDIDTRDIDLTKTITGVAPEGETFAVQYSLDEGYTWLPQTPDVPLSLDPDGDPVTIKDVPVLDLAKLNATPSTEVNTKIQIREALGSNADIQSVSWTLDSNALSSTYTSDGTFQYSVATFETGPVTDATIVPTPRTNVGVTNSYLEVSVDKHIDGLLDGIGSTTLLPFGEDEMTIRYTVTTKEDPASVTLSDPSLINDLFDLPENLLDSNNNLSGCILTPVNGQEDTYSCEFAVTFADPKALFHYDADQAEVTATVTKTDGDRTITATATDKHGAMRLPNILGQLPDTGVTTLVSVLALGLIAALGALALYVRSRRK